MTKPKITKVENNGRVTEPSAWQFTDNDTLVTIVRVDDGYRLGSPFLQRWQMFDDYAAAAEHVDQLGLAIKAAQDADRVITELCPLVPIVPEVVE